MDIGRTIARGCLAPFVMVFRGVGNGLSKLGSLFNRLAETVDGLVSKPRAKDTAAADHQGPSLADRAAAAGAVAHEKPGNAGSGKAGSGAGAGAADAAPRSRRAPVGQVLGIRINGLPEGSNNLLAAMIGNRHFIEAHVQKGFEAKNATDPEPSAQKQKQLTSALHVTGLLMKALGDPEKYKDRDPCYAFHWLYWGQAGVPLASRGSGDYSISETKHSRVLYELNRLAAFLMLGNFGHDNKETIGGTESPIYAGRRDLVPLDKTGIHETTFLNTIYGAIRAISKYQGVELARDQAGRVALIMELLESEEGKFRLRQAGVEKEIVQELAIALKTLKADSEAVGDEAVTEYYNLAEVALYSLAKKPLFTTALSAVPPEGVKTFADDVSMITKAEFVEYLQAQADKAKTE